MFAPFSRCWLSVCVWFLLSFGSLNLVHLKKNSRYWKVLGWRCDFNPSAAPRRACHTNLVDHHAKKWRSTKLSLQISRRRVIAESKEANTLRWKGSKLRTLSFPLVRSHACWLFALYSRCSQLLEIWEIHPLHPSSNDWFERVSRRTSKIWFRRQTRTHWAILMQRILLNWRCARAFAGCNVYIALEHKHWDYSQTLR